MIAKIIRIMLGVYFLIFFAGYSHSVTPFACYAFDGNGNDGSSNGYHAEVVGATSVTDRNNASGKALYFTGVASPSNSVDYVSYAKITDAADFHITDKLTISAWVKPDVTNVVQTIINKWYAPDSYALSIEGGNYKFVVNLDGDQIVYVSAPATVGVWAHVVGVFDGSQIKIYKDGQLIQTKNAQGVLRESNMPIYVANHPAWNPFKGVIDNLKLYNAALSSAEISADSSIACPAENNVISENSPTFVYPANNSSLGYYGCWIFKVNPVNVITGNNYLWGFSQDGLGVWENYLDEGALSGTEYSICPGTAGYSRFNPGATEVSVRALLPSNSWSEAGIINVILMKPVELSVSCPASLTLGGTGNCAAQLLYHDNSQEAVAATWSSSSAEVTVDSDGKLTAGQHASSATIAAIYTIDGQSFSGMATVSVVAPINSAISGVCGAAHNTVTTNAPTSNMCSSGTAGSITGSSMLWAWSCSGSNGGTTASCSANRAVSAEYFTPNSDFIDNGDGTVYHKLTGLTWMRCSMGQTWDGATCGGTASTYTWEQAKALTTNFAGQNDWRLPSPWELVSIVDYDRVSPTTINDYIFRNMTLKSFWSSFPYAGNSDDAWFVEFHNSLILNGNRSSGFAVRLVRSGQSVVTLTTPTSDFTDNGDGTVTHKTTRLTWKRCAEGQTWSGSTCNGTTGSYTYDQASVLSDTFAGHTDWRVPNVQELQSIVEYGVSYPMINNGIFPNALSTAFFSGTHVSYYSDQAWFVNFLSGDIGRFRRSSSFGAVRLVRGVQYSDLLPSTSATNGACGTAHGGSFSSAPTNNLCAAGTTGTLPSSGVSGTGPWTWSCTGSNGGTTASCSANWADNTMPGFIPHISGNLANYSLSVSLTVTDPTEIGRGGAIFVVAYLPDVGFFALSSVSSMWYQWNGMTTLTNYSLPESLGTHEVTIVSNMDVSFLPSGTEIYVGYGLRLPPQYPILVLPSTGLYVDYQNYNMGLSQAQDYMLEKSRFSRVATF